MCHGPLGGAEFFRFLVAVDAEMAQAAHEEGCRHCGGPLYRGDYPRKPRGVEGLPREYERRASYCCGREGCRRRRTPPSVRFLGRKVYLGAVVILLSAMRHGVTERRAARLRTLVGVSRETLLRWRQWWRTTFVATRFWRSVRGRFLPPVATDELPRSLVERWRGRGGGGWLALLRFLAPATTASDTALSS